MSLHSDSPEYLEKKKFFSQLLTVYGRKPVLEALKTEGVDAYRLHLSDSNKKAAIIDEIISCAKQKGAEILYHDKEALARISKNKKQDQGVAIDLKLSGFQELDNFLHDQQSLSKLTSPENSPLSNNRSIRLLALCDIHNPQNLGMIIRSACAGNIDGILIPDKGCAQLSPLVIKASAGTLFKAPIIKCRTLKDALQKLQHNGFSVGVLSSHTKESIFASSHHGSMVYVLGNESEGVSPEIFKLADKKLMIPMANDVESLNVAVTAALIAFNTNL